MANSLTSSGLSITHTFQVVTTSGVAQPSAPSIGGLTVSASKSSEVYAKLPSSGTYMVINFERGTNTQVFSTYSYSGGTSLIEKAVGYFSAVRTA